MIFTDLDLVDAVFRNSLKIFELSGALQTRWERLFSRLNQCGSEHRGLSLCRSKSAALASFPERGSWIGNYGVVVKCQQPFPVMLYYHVCLHLPFILVLQSIFGRYVAIACVNCVNQGHVMGYEVNCHITDRN